MALFHPPPKLDASEEFAGQVRIGTVFQTALRGVSSLPGVSGAALTSNFPASSVDNEKTLFTIQGRSALQASEAPAADLQIISGDYFSVLKIPLVAGRSFTEADTAERTARRPHKPDNGGPLLAQERSLGAKIQAGRSKLGRALDDCSWRGGRRPAELVGPRNLPRRLSALSSVFEKLVSVPPACHLESGRSQYGGACGDLTTRSANRYNRDHGNFDDRLRNRGAPAFFPRRLRNFV